jgi:Family of unknown function (DUF6541)
MFRRFWDIVVLLVLAMLWLIPEPLLKVPLGMAFFFLPGFSITKLLSAREKKDIVDFLIYTTLISFASIPLLAYIIQILVPLSPYSLLLGLLVFSIPVLVLSKTKSNQNQTPEAPEEPKAEGSSILGKAMIFMAALAIGLGLYVQASLGTVSPRGWDIFTHMNTVNRIVSTGGAVLLPSVYTLSNFYHFSFASLVLLTGLDVPLVGVIGQTMLGALFMMSIFYFANTITKSPTASLISAVLFIAGPPLYTSMKTYYWYFHPMYVALALLPFAAAVFHESLSRETKRGLGLSALLITAVALFHLIVGLFLFFILFFDFVFILIRQRKRAVLIDFSKIVVVSLALSAVITIPFLVNLTNPFKYVYVQGGLQTLYTMFFGVSQFVLVSSAKGPAFLATVFAEFRSNILPLLLLGLPGLIYLAIKKRASFLLILACLLTGLLGVLQPVIGLAFMPQRFSSGLILFGSVMVGATLLSVKFYFSALRSFVAKRMEKTRFHPKLPKVSLPRGSTVVAGMWVFILLYTFIVFFSPAQSAVLSAELEIREQDMTAIKEIDRLVPRDSKVLIDHYLQFFFTGITGRNPLYSISETISYPDQWAVYPLNVYGGVTDPVDAGLDYVVISPWCYTTSQFAGKAYFDQHEDLVQIYELYVERGLTASYTGYYAVYRVIR